MSQHDFNISNQTASATRADLNNALGALASLSSGTTAPTTTYANMLWYETDTNWLWVRNEADSAWVRTLYFNQSTNKSSVLDDTQIVTTSGNQTGILGDQTTATWQAGTGTLDSLVSPANVKAAIEALVPAPTVGWQPYDGGTGILYNGGVVNLVTTGLFQSGYDYRVTFENISHNVSSGRGLCMQYSTTPITVAGTGLAISNSFSGSNTSELNGYVDIPNPVINSRCHLFTSKLDYLGDVTGYDGSFLGTSTTKWLYGAFFIGTSLGVGTSSGSLGDFDQGTIRLYRKVTGIIF